MFYRGITKVSFDLFQFHGNLIIGINLKFMKIESNVKE